MLKNRALERTNYEQELMLRQSEKLATLGRLSAGIAHELNNPAAAMFIFIGTRAHTEAFQAIIACDEQGFILTGPDLAQEGGRPKGWRLNRDPFLNETSVPGIFAAGDVRAGSIRRVASARIGHHILCT